MFLLAKNSSTEISVRQDALSCRNTQMFLTFGLTHARAFSDCVALRHKLFVNDSLAVKEATQHAMIFDLLSLAFWGGGGIGEVEVVPFHALALETRHVPRNGGNFQSVPKSQDTFPFPDVLLVVRNIYWERFCTDFSHPQFTDRNMMNGGATKMQFFPDRSDRQPTIRTHEILDSVDILSDSSS